MTTMRRPLLWSCVLLLAAGGTPLSAQPAPTLRKAALLLPTTTSSASAREHFEIGQRLLDLGRPTQARPHFEQAVRADGDFALAHLQLASAAESATEFKLHLDHAVQRAARASEPERLLIQIAERGLRGDVEGQLQLAQQLTRVEPANPRTWLALAGVQQALGREADARATMGRAIQAAPSFAPAHLALAQSFLAEPRDLAQAEQNARHAVEQEPNEPTPHDVLGDVHRMQGKLQEARADYTRAAELDPGSGLALQQRGHVNCFLGNYDQARADYDAAIRLGQANEPATYGVWRALVQVHAGKPDAGLAELQQLVQAVDGMNLPDPDGTRIFALSELVLIALHTGKHDVAERAIAQRAALVRREAERIGTEEYRRMQEADVALYEGRLALRKGDYATARAKAAEAMRLRAAEPNPRKHEGAHGLLAMTTLKQKNYAEALTHFADADPNNVYLAYHHAQALEGAGRASEAKAMYKKVASYAFNNAGIALVRTDAMQKAKM